MTALIAAGAVFYVRWQDQQAFFDVYALGHYLRALDMVEGKRLSGLSDLPDIRINSFGHSLVFDAPRLRQRTAGGYLYDFQRGDGGRFLITASPIRLRGVRKEYAMLDDMNMRVNPGSGNSLPAYEDVKKWPIIPAQYDLVTAAEK